MRIAALLAALLLLASPLAARAAVPTASCPDILLGDSLAVGMGPYARAAGFQVIARTGIGLSWLRAQSPRCARRVVVVLGTNDLRGIDPWSAEAYPERLAAIMSRWQAEQITWATPGCFPYDESLERGSEALSRALAREPLVRVGSGRGYMRVHSGRPARCSYLSGDGIHPSGAGYRAWWANLSQSIGPEPEERQFREARSDGRALARLPVRTLQHARSDRQARTVRQASSARHALPNQRSRAVLARADRPGRTLRQAGAERATRSVQAAPSARMARTAPQAHPQRTARTPGHAGPVRQARSVQPARPTRQARSAPPSYAPRDVRPLRPPVPRLVAGTPTRRT